MTNLISTVRSEISSSVRTFSQLPFVKATTAILLAHPALSAIALVGLLFLSIGLYLLHRHHAQQINPQASNNVVASALLKNPDPHTRQTTASQPPKDPVQETNTQDPVSRVEKTTAKVLTTVEAQLPPPVNPIEQKRAHVKALLGNLRDAASPSALIAKKLLQNVPESNPDFVTSPLFTQFCEAAKRAKPSSVESPEKNIEEFKVRLVTFLNDNATWLSQKDIEQLVALIDEEYNTPVSALPFEQKFCELIVRQSLLGDVHNLNAKKSQILQELASNNTALGLALKYMLEHDCSLTDGKLEDAEFLELTHKLAQAALAERADGASALDEEKQNALASVVKGFLEHCQRVGALAVLTQNDFDSLRNVIETDVSAFPKTTKDHLQIVVQKAFETASAEMLTDKEKELFKDLRAKASFNNLDNDLMFNKAWFSIWSTESAIVRYRKAIAILQTQPDKIALLEKDLANRTNACKDSVQELFNAQKTRLEKTLTEKLNTAKALLKSFDTTTLSGAIANDILSSATRYLEKQQQYRCNSAKAIDEGWNNLKTTAELQWLTNPLFIRFCTAISKTSGTAKSLESLKKTKETLENLFKLTEDAEIALADQDFQQLVVSINSDHDFSSEFQKIIQNKSAATRQALYIWITGTSCDITKFTLALAAAFQDLQEVAEDKNAAVDLKRLNLLSKFLVFNVLTSASFKKDSTEFKQIKDIVKSKQYQNAVKNIQHQLTKQHLDLIENKMQSLNTGEDETLLWEITDQQHNPIQENFHTLQVCAEKADVVQAIVAKTVETKPSKKAKYRCDTQNQNLLTFSKFSTSLPKVVSIIRNLTDPESDSVAAVQKHDFTSFVTQQFNAFQEFVLHLPYAIGYLPKATDLIKVQDKYDQKNKTGEITTPVIQDYYSGKHQTILAAKQGSRLEPDNFLIGPTQISCRFVLIGSEIQKQMRRARESALLPFPTDKKPSEFALASFNAYVEVAADFAATVNSLKVWLETTTIRSTASN